MNGRAERCCCCIHIHAAVCAIGAIQLIFSFVWSATCFMNLYVPQSNIHLPHVVNEFMLEEYGEARASHFIMWACLASLFLASIFLLFGHSTHRPKWYLPSMVVNTILIGRYFESQLVYILNEKQPSTFFWVYSIFLVINTYFTIMIYKGKTYMDWLCMEHVEAKNLDDFVVRVDRDVDEYQPHASTSRHRATAPPMSENEYYVLH